MDAFTILAWFLIWEPILVKFYQYLFTYRPLYFNLDAGFLNHSFSANDMSRLFCRFRQVGFMAMGVILLSIITGMEITEKGLSFLWLYYFLSLFCIIQPCLEILYFRWIISRNCKATMTAKEMSAFHDFKQKFYRNPLALNGSIRQRVRFFMLSFGILSLFLISIYIF